MCHSALLSILVFLAALSHSAWFLSFPASPACCLHINYILSPFSCLLQLPFLLSLSSLFSFITYTHSHSMHTYIHTYICTHTHILTHMCTHCMYIHVHTDPHMGTCSVHSHVQYCRHTHPSVNTCTHTCASMHVHLQALSQAHVRRHSILNPSSAYKRKHGICLSRCGSFLSR